jgi:hypothetical protein
MLKAQREVGELTAKNKALEAEVYELKLSSARKSGAARTKADKGASPGPISSVSANSGAGSVSASATAGPNKALVLAIKRLGRYTQLECSPILPASAFGHPKPSFRHDSPQRYTAENIAFGFTADLYHCVPPAYHDKILNNSDVFRDTVS